MNLQDIIDETIEEIERGENQASPGLPLQSHRATKQVIARFPFVLEDFFTVLDAEKLEMQEQQTIVADTLVFADTSLVMFIAKAAERQMGNRYRQLLERRLDAASSQTAYAE